MIDVSELMSDPDFCRTVTLRRFTVSYANEGVATQVPTDSTITAIVQAASARDLVKFQIEATRVKRIKAFYTNAEVRLGNATDQVSDVIIVDGVSYTAVEQNDWGENGYYMTLGEAMDTGTPTPVTPPEETP
jgi:hypothetical protein